MSEFLIICGKKPKVDGLANVLLVDLMDAESLVVEAAEALLSAEERAEAFTVRDAEGCFDTLFAEAQRELLDGKSILDTRIGAVLQRVLPSASQLLLWYGDDWQNLPEVVDAQTFLQRLDHDLRAPSGESWHRYRNPALVRAEPTSLPLEQAR